MTIYYTNPEKFTIEDENGRRVVREMPTYIMPADELLAAIIANLPNYTLVEVAVEDMTLADEGER